MKKNLIIADDHKMFLEGLVFILEEKYNIVFTSNDGERVVSYLKGHPNQQIDLIITDISMPNLDGIELTEMVKNKYPNIKLLVLSMYHKPATINKLIENKVDGYLLKDSTKTELITAIKTILSGKSFFSEKVKRSYSESIFSNEKDILQLISEKEKKILALIAMEHTTKEISEILFLSKYTIDSYRKNLISKLNVRNIAGLTKIAMNLGLVDEFLDKEKY